ncbi:MAG: DUF4384 domain-containing protein [Blastocatellia bacterium]|nr:DUF4384 domain-containing protein [Blastocatellia bacterium]
MKYTICLVGMIFYLLAGGVQPVLPGQNPDRDNSRGLFEEKRADGLRFELLKFDGIQFQPVDTKQIFSAGDRVKFRFRSNFAGYVYLVNITPTGKVQVLFPKAGVEARVDPDQPYVFPSSANGFGFDEERGTEVIQVFVARQPIPLFDRAVRISGGLVERNSQPQGSMTAEKTVPAINTEVAIMPELQANGVISRSVKLVPGRQVATQRAEPMTVVAQAPVAPPAVQVAERPKATFQPNEVGVFELRLRHQ